MILRRLRSLLTFVRGQERLRFQSPPLARVEERYLSEAPLVFRLSQGEELTGPDIHLETDEFGGKSGQPIELPLGKSVLDLNVLAF